MPAIIKGFAANDRYVSNLKDVVAEFGELSTEALSFSRDVGRYISNARPATDDIILHVFSQKDGERYVAFSENNQSHVIGIISFIYDKVATTRVYSDVLGNQLIEGFASYISHVEVGPTVENNNVFCPEWVSWTQKSNGTKYKWWFSDKAFRRQYDEFEIIVVPAVPVIADLLKPVDKVREAVSKQTATELNRRVELAKNNIPPTVTRVYECDWIDRTNAGNKVNTTWTAIIYGNAGDNIDAMKDAFVDYILKNSTTNRDTWKDILPDIFKRTEFTIIPRWDLYAIPNKAISEGIYSPMVRMAGIYAFAYPYCPTYPQQHVRDNICFLAHYYRSLSMIVVGGNENKNNTFLLTGMFPDYIAESSLTQDFNRMSERTRKFAELLANMVITAERLDDHTDLPVGLFKVRRNGKLFVLASYENIHYLVAAKSNFKR